MSTPLTIVRRAVEVALCILCFWFLSGLIILDGEFPRVTRADRLARSAALDPATIRFSLAEAAATAGVDGATPVRLNTLDGRPVYRFRIAPECDVIVYADTGAPQRGLSTETMTRIASSWATQPATLATMQAVGERDRWIAASERHDVTAVWKYSWPDGQQVYISQLSGDVVHYTTRASRWRAYLSALPQGLYRTLVWKDATLHEDSADDGNSARVSDAITRALRGPEATGAAFEAKQPRDAVAQVADLQVTELELASLAGEPAYLATLRSGDTRVLPLKGDPQTDVDWLRIVAALTRAAQPLGGAEISVVGEYDEYYRESRRAGPLPVILARLHDPHRTRYYIDPKTARVVDIVRSEYTASGWWSHVFESFSAPEWPAWCQIALISLVWGAASRFARLVPADRKSTTRAIDPP